MPVRSRPVVFEASRVAAVADSRPCIWQNARSALGGLGLAWIRGRCFEIILATGYATPVPPATVRPH
jgi:hypothetical protein